MKKRGRELAESHWRSYVKPLLEAHGVDDAVIKVCGFHYVSAGEHFYSHGWEDANVSHEQFKDGLLNVDRKVST